MGKIHILTLLILLDKRFQVIIAVKDAADYASIPDITDFVFLTDV